MVKTEARNKSELERLKKENPDCEHIPELEKQLRECEENRTLIALAKNSNVGDHIAAKNSYDSFLIR